MIKINETTWKKVKDQIDKKLAEQIEFENYISTLKLEKVSVKILFGNEIPESKDIICEKLSDNWAIGPIVDYDGNIIRTRGKTLTHINSGRKAVTCPNRKAVLKLWEEIKDLNIHFSDPNDLVNSEDFYKFKQICEKYEY